MEVSYHKVTTEQIEFIVSASEENIDPWQFILKDETLENKFSFNLKASLMSAKPYLEGWLIYLTPSILPSPKEMTELIKQSGGRVELVSGVVGRRSGNSGARGRAGTFTVTCVEDRKLWRLLPRPLVKTDAIMSGSFRHTLNLNKYIWEGSEDV